MPSSILGSDASDPGAGGKPAISITPSSAWWRRPTLRVFLARGLAVWLCTATLIVFVLTSVFAPWIAPYEPNAQDLVEALDPPSVMHLLGQDSLGRDMLSRLIYGGQVSLSVSFLAGTLAAMVGTGLGLLAGYSDGLGSRAIMSVTDIVLSIPNLVFSLILVAVLGGGLLSVVLAIGLSMVPSYIRMVNGLVLSLRENDYITAARLIGQKERLILTRHLLPNSFPTLIVLYTVNLGTAVLTESTLSYLGVGIGPPTASWGSMVSDVYPYLLAAPWLVIGPGLCIALVIVSFNVVGDGLREALDPRLKGKL